jgi:hypothetical protein
MNRIILLLVSTIFSTSLFSQGNGELIVNLGIDVLEDETYTFTLSQNEKVVFTEIYAVYEEIHATDLVPGVYVYTLYRNETNGARAIISDTVQIISERITHLDLSYYTYSDYYEFDEVDSIGEVIDYSKGEIKLGAYYGSNIPDGDNLFLNEFGFSFNQGGMATLSKHIGFIGSVGYDYSQTYFTKDSSLITLENRTLERYSSLNLNFSIGFRFATHNLRKYTLKGAFLDIGTTYYLPLRFRHVVVYDKDKISRRGIHEFTDWRAYAAIGWFPVQVFAEYRIMDFMKENYPELPQYRIGVRALIIY